MDHRASFGKILFGVTGDDPDPAQAAAMKSAKWMIFEALGTARPALTYGRAGVLVDERYGQDVIDAAVKARDTGGGGPGVALAVPVEASGHDWFTPEWDEQWLGHVEAIRPDYAKVLVRDNPDFEQARREQQFGRLAQVSSALRGIGVPLLYELLVPATGAQLDRADRDRGAYDRDLRPGLVVLGRDAPADRLDHWLEVASQVGEFVGFAIGRSIWEDAVRQYEASDRGAAAASAARAQVAERYLGFVAHWRPAA
jgi:myo-inositol catabolism protein IolC